MPLDPVVMNVDPRQKSSEVTECGETILIPVIERLGRIEDMDRSFDIAFWQAQSASARLDAAWELVVFHQQLKGTADELRLQRTVESLQRKRG